MGLPVFSIVPVLLKPGDRAFKKYVMSAGIAGRTLTRHMSMLKEAGRIERIGGKRFGNWKVK